jgi:hypothetical protein
VAERRLPQETETEEEEEVVVVVMAAAEEEETAGEGAVWVGVRTRPATRRRFMPRSCRRSLLRSPPGGRPRGGQPRRERGEKKAPGAGASGLAKRMRTQQGRSTPSTSNISCTPN